MRSTKSVSAEVCNSGEKVGFPLLKLAPLAHGSTEDALSAGDHLRTVFRLLHTQIEHDFSSYKRSPVSQRIARRITICQVDDLAGFVQLLHQEPQEVETLFH